MNISSLNGILGSRMATSLLIKHWNVARVTVCCTSNVRAPSFWTDFTANNLTSGHSGSRGLMVTCIAQTWGTLVCRPFQLETTNLNWQIVRLTNNAAYSNRRSIVLGWFLSNRTSLSFPAVFVVIDWFSKHWATVGITNRRVWKLNGQLSSNIFNCGERLPENNLHYAVHLFFCRFRVPPSTLSQSFNTSFRCSSTNNASCRLVIYVKDARDCLIIVTGFEGIHKSLTISITDLLSFTSTTTLMFFFHLWHVNVKLLDSCYIIMNINVRIYTNAHIGKLYFNFVKLNDCFINRSSVGEALGDFY